MLQTIRQGAVHAAMVWLMAVESSHAATYYVAPNGSSGNDGSASAPWRQIRDALPHLAPGDTVLVADGSYLGFTIDDVAGTAAAPITIRATGPNVVVTVTTDRPDNRDTIKLAFCSYIVIDGLTAFNGNRAGLRVDTSDHITIRNCEFGNNTTWGIFTNHSDYLLIEFNECYGSALEHGIYVSNSCVFPVVRCNRSYNNRGNGLHFNGDLSAGAPGVITGALVEKNVISNNGLGGGAGINMDGVRSSVVRNNLLYNNHASGIALFRENAAFGPSGVQVYHNTIDMASDARWALLIKNTDQNAGKILVRNNILNNRNTARGGITYGTSSDVANTDSDYNIMDKVTPNDANTIYTLTQWKAQGYEPHSLSATNVSLFVSLTTPDYHLLDNAPARGKGQPLSSVVDDMDGYPRPPSGPTDIGCYQKVGSISGVRAGGGGAEPNVSNSRRGRR